MIRLFILADDFTGGLDTGVQFAEKGIRTRVITNPDVDFERAAQGCQVLVVVVETRHLFAREAGEIVGRIVKKCADLGVPYLYKKTDSALRGNIGAELSAALAASGADTLYFLPAMPGIQRTTVNGVHYISGVPVAESVFGKDPFEPVRHSSVRELIASQSGVKVWNAAPDSIPQEKGIVAVDAQTDEDLLQAGRILKDRKGLRITAGCAGFASVLPDVLGLERDEKPAMPELGDGLFVLCGSVNPITQRQLAYAEKNGFTRVHIAPEQKLDPDYFETAAGQAALREWQERNAREPWFILDANDTDDANMESAAYAAWRAMTTEDVRSCISGALGRILPGMLESAANKTVLITGGDTLLQCMNQMRVWEMEPLLQVFPGVVLSRFGEGSASRYVITKSGGFGKETLLDNLKTLIRKQNTDGQTA